MSQFFRSHGMHSQYEYPRLEEAKNIKPTTIPHLTPYLGPRSRLSQLWFNRWTLLLVLVIVRVLISTQSLDDDLDSAHREALSACTAVERAGTAMASMPHYMAPGVNELTAKTIESGVRALHQSLSLVITGVQEIIVFVINMIVSTYVCLITFAIHGALSLVLDATKEITEALNETIKSVVEGIDDAVGDFQGELNDVLEAIGDGIGNIFGGGFDPPELNIPGLDRLRELQIPTSFMDGINKANEKVDELNFDNVKEKANDAIRLPFKSIKAKIDNNLNVYEFDRSILPVPLKEKVSFCSENNDINDFFLNLKLTVSRVKNIVLGILAAAAVLVIIPMWYLEHRRWMVTRERAYMFAHNPNYDPVDVTHLAARPTTGTFGLRVASWFKSDRRKVLVRWAVAYVTSPPALFVLSLGIAGLIGALAQFVVLKQVEAAAPELAKQVGNFAGDVVDMLNGASLRSAQTTNQVLEGVTEELNENLFGWLTEGTQTLNDTLNAFTNEMENGVENFLGDTPLAGPAKEIIRCIIGLKIESLQKGLTWLHDNAKISFPGIPEDTFSLGAIDSLDSSGTGSDSFLSDPEGASSDMITDTLLKTTERWESMITEEAAISGAVVGVWVIVALIALIRIACLFWGKEKTRGEGGGQGTVFTGNGRAAVVPAASKAMSPSPPYHEEFPQQIKEHSGPSISNNPYHPKESVDSHRHQQPYANDDDLEWGNDVKRASWENDNDFGHQPKRV